MAGVSRRSRALTSSIPQSWPTRIIVLVARTKPPKKVNTLKARKAYHMHEAALIRVTSTGLIERRSEVGPRASNGR